MQTDETHEEPHPKRDYYEDLETGRTPLTEDGASRTWEELHREPPKIH
jgi:hypothetical protein